MSVLDEQVVEARQVAAALPGCSDDRGGKKPLQVSRVSSGTNSVGFGFVHCGVGQERASGDTVQLSWHDRLRELGGHDYLDSDAADVSKAMANWKPTEVAS